VVIKDENNAKALLAREALEELPMAAPNVENYHLFTHSRHNVVNMVGTVDKSFLHLIFVP
jgi:hypothetical protein